MTRWLALLLCIRLCLGQICPLPATSLLRRLDLATCDAGDRPPPPAETTQQQTQKETSLPSFDEWKEKHAEELKRQGKRSKPKPVNDSSASAANATASASVNASVEGSAVNESTPAAVPQTDEAEGERAFEGSTTALTATSYVHPLPNSGSGGSDDPLLPLRSRTNYASQDCAAVVLQSSKASKHASSVLNSKKDRYMLTPCNADPKYVIVELCEEIDIDTVVLANWEFFSSMFKLFRASVSEVYPGRAEDWHELGVFRAGNLRGSQVFKPKKRGGFQRYIRLDFLTHYGTEYYCPVSLLEVYGRTQMESYRDEERAREEATRRAQALLGTEEASEDEVAEEEEVPTTFAEVAAPTIEMRTESDSASAVTSASAAQTPSVAISAPSPSASRTRMETSHVASESPFEAASSRTPTLNVSEAIGALPESSSVDAPSAAVISNTTSAAIASTTAHVASLNNTAQTSAANATVSEPSASASLSLNATAIATNGNATVSNGRGQRNETRSTSASLASATGPSGESIYGTIMKRLNALETNATLGFKYIEEQRKLVSASIAKLEKQFAASEASRKQDSQLIRRLILDFDLHRAKLEEERQTLAAQVTVLANEIVFERRLGLAQLLALLVVLAFVALTRGSSVPLVSLPAQRSRFATSPTDLLRHKSLDRPRRAHASMPPDKLMARSVSLLPRAPPPQRRSIGSFPPNRNHRRSRSLTPSMTELDLPASAAIVPPSPLISDRWVSSSESDVEEERSHKPRLSLDGTAFSTKGSPSSSQPLDSPDVASTTPTLSEALRPIMFNA